MQVEHDGSPVSEAVSQRNTNAPADSLAATAVLNVIAKSAAVIVAGILVWGFNRIDRSLEEMNSTLNRVQLAIGRLETDRENVRERINVLEMRLGHSERATVR